MTLRRPLGKTPNPRTFLVVADWKLDGDAWRTTLEAKSESREGALASSMLYAQEHFPIEVGFASHDRQEEEFGQTSNEICCSNWLLVRGSSSVDPNIQTPVVHAQQTETKVIACVKETAEESASERTEELLGQLRYLTATITDWSHVVIAFEALWASGTGVLATPAQVQEALAKIREWLRVNVSEKVANTTRILYAGSVSSTNCRQLAQLPDLDGFLLRDSTPMQELIGILASSRVSRSSLWATHRNVKSTANLIRQLKCQEDARRLSAATRCPRRYI